MTRKPGSRVGGRRWLTLAAAALALGAGRSGAQGAAPHPPRPTTADQAFIDMMVPHHQQGIAMAEQAVAKANRAEVRQLAQKMIDEQRRDVAEMRDWRRRWFGSDSTPPPMMTMDMPAGPEFDRMWLTEIFKHHDMAIASSEITARSSARATVKQKARQMSNAQHEDQQKIATWLREWFNQPAPSAGPARRASGG